MLACCSFSSNATTIGVVTEHLIKKNEKETAARLFRLINILIYLSWAF